MPRLLPLRLMRQTPIRFPLKDTPAGKILVVDDQPINIKLLQRKLEREGFIVETATTGVECLDAVADNPPDLILLDVMMPEMDGIETCQRLKEAPETEDIPIIFITAKSSKEGKLEGLGAGASDYITKPIDLDETLARVKTQLRIQEVYRQNLELQRRLGEARKAAAVGAITQGIAHNLNNLLGVVVGYLDLLKSGFDSPDMVKRSVHLMDQAIQRMVDIIRHLSSIATHEKHELKEVELRRLIKGAVERFQRESKWEDAPIEVLLSTPEDFVVPANIEIMEGVLVQLLTNAAEAYDRQTPTADRRIEVTADLTDNDVIILILDNGTGIDDRIEETLFEPFITTKTSVGRGLGLSMARHIVRSFQGELELKNRPEGGAVARVRYPLEPVFLEMNDTGLPVSTTATLGGRI